MECNKTTIILILLFCVKISFATEYFVDGSTARSGNGSKSSPFRTIQEAADIMKPGDVCLIAGGIYSETITPAFSGTKSNPIVFQPLSKKDRVVITGLDQVLSSLWKEDPKNLFKAIKPTLDVMDASGGTNRKMTLKVLSQK
ncbi:MAG: DUF1565 domain-containing protein [Bacteroidetes bacterium]|nr:DUF1565 domain-containing protein [Bacteroidota bacterium]